MLSTINEFIEEENGNPITEEDFLIDCDMDSFSYMMFWFKMDEEFECFDKEYIMNINYVTLTVKDILDRIKSHGS